MQRVFVYGTLMRGRPNHSLLTSNGAIANFYGEGVTAENWPLVVGTSCFIPLLLDARGSGKKVSGDVFEVDDEMMKRLDKLEGHPLTYERTQIDVHVASGNAIDHGPKDAHGITISCWAYLFRKFKPELLTLPFMDQYAGDIVNKYIPGQKRAEKRLNPFVEVKLDCP